MKLRANNGNLNVFRVTAGLVMVAVAVCGLRVLGSKDFVQSYLK